MKTKLVKMAFVNTTFGDWRAYSTDIAVLKKSFGKKCVVKMVRLPITNENT